MEASVPTSAKVEAWDAACASLAKTVVQTYAVD
jgi:hypothetical protein